MLHEKFYCFFYPKKYRKNYFGYSNILKIECNLPGNWVKIANFHITLFFLGYRVKEEIDEIILFLNSIKFNFNDFKFKLDKLDFFKHRYGQTIVISLNPLGDLFDFYMYLSDFLIKKKYIKGNKRFVPHITIARIKSLKKIQKIKVPSLTFLPKDLTIFSSKLTMYGPIYTKYYSILN